MVRVERVCEKPISRLLAVRFGPRTGESTLAHRSARPIRSFSALPDVTTGDHPIPIPTTAQALFRAAQDRPITLLSPPPPLLLATLQQHHQHQHPAPRPDAAYLHRTQLRRPTHHLPASCCCSLTCAVPRVLYRRRCPIHRPALLLLLLLLPNPPNQPASQSRPACASANHAPRPPPRSTTRTQPASAPRRAHAHRIHAPACSDVHSLHVASSTRQHSAVLHACCCCRSCAAIPAT